MEPPHPLKILLQLQLASDSSAALHLPYILGSLTPEFFLPSPHIQKWTTRITSLLHSKDPGARWAGLCLAYRTSIFSKPTMIASAHGWLSVALPMLSKNEPKPTLKSSVRLLRHMLTAAMDVPEFQRQVATPNVLKFTSATIALIEKHADFEFQMLLLSTLAHLVPLYPAPHRTLHATLSNLSLKFLNGSAPNPMNGNLLEAASHLYSVLPITGGKVGAANLWKKSVDETLAFAWSAFLGLRTTFPIEKGRNPLHQASHPTDDPLISIPLNLDRLRCCIVVLCDLLRRSNANRSVPVPLGALTDFCTALLSCTVDEHLTGHADPAIRAMELSAIPEIERLGCDLIVCLAKCTRCHLTPHLTRFISYLTFHLEQKMISSQRIYFLQAVRFVLSNSQPLHSSSIVTRLAKAVLPTLTIVLASQPEVQHIDSSASSSNKSKKGKKRARGYEGDEVFRLSRELICPTVDDGRAVLTALDVLALILRNPNLASAVHSICCRVLLSMLLALSQMSPVSLSPDPTLHKLLLGKVQTITAELSSGTTSALSKSLSLVIGSVLSEESDLVLYTANTHHFDTLLHPRVPPLVRSLPHVESLSLFRAEESQEETDLRTSLGLEITGPKSLPMIQNSTIEGVYGSDPKSTDPKPLKVTQDVNMDKEPSFTRPRYASIPLPSPTVRTHTPLPELPQVAELDQPSSSIVVSTPTPPVPESPPSSADTLKQPTPVAPFVKDNEEEEEDMPAIDMDSDSD